MQILFSMQISENKNTPTRLTMIERTKDPIKNSDLFMILSFQYPSETSSRRQKYVGLLNNLST